MDRDVSATTRSSNHSEKKDGALYIVGTPIGNLEDITLRALRTLKEVDLIAAEDTRHTRKLLTRYDIHTPQIAYHEHNKRAKTPKIISKLKDGARIALVSDAGMPGISDPGQDLIACALQENIEVNVIPGPSSILTALSLSGFSGQSFSFEGFAPRKKGERKLFLERILSGDATSVVFESPNRVSTLLADIGDLAPQCKLAVARELTKKFEEVLRGTAQEMAVHFAGKKPRGEFVIVIQGEIIVEKRDRSDDIEDMTDLIAAVMDKEGVPKKEAMRLAAKKLGVSRREVYRRMIEEKDNG